MRYQAAIAHHGVHRRPGPSSRLWPGRSPNRVSRPGSGSPGSPMTDTDASPNVGHTGQVRWNTGRAGLTAPTRPLATRCGNKPPRPVRTLTTPTRCSLSDPRVSSPGVRPALASGRFRVFSQDVRHCERSEAIHGRPVPLDCFAALAMTCVSIAIPPRACLGEGDRRRRRWWRGRTSRHSPSVSRCATATSPRQARRGIRPNQAVTF